MRAISIVIYYICLYTMYRHSEEMIKNLETAGLGFYVRETQQKLGESKKYTVCIVENDCYVYVYR